MNNNSTTATQRHDSRRMRLTPTWILLAFLAVLGADLGRAQTTTIFVDPTSPTPTSPFTQGWATAAHDLQAAIDLAETTQGEVNILVAEGTYYPQIQGGSPRERYFLLGSTNPNASNERLRIVGGFLGYSNGASTSDDPDNPDGNPVRTVLTGNPQTPGQGQAVHVMLIEQGNAPQTELTIERLSIVGGLADDEALTPYGNDGAGVQVRRVTDCTVQFRSVQFGNNYARPVPGSQQPSRGGAVFVTTGQDTEVRFASCTFVGNSATQGGAVYLQVANEARIGNCRFHNNGTFVDNLQAPGVGYTMPICEQGGGLYIFEQATALLSNNLIYDNAARFQGGGVFWLPIREFNPGITVQKIRHCTITLNAVQGTLGPQIARGAGVFVAPGDVQGTQIDPETGALELAVKRMDIANSIIWGNRFGDDLSIEGDAAQSITGVHAFLRYNYIGVRQAYNTTPIPLWSGIEEPVGNIIGNLTNPFLNLASRNFRLTASSPCRDAGQNENVMVGPQPLAAEFDFVGRDIVDLNGVLGTTDVLLYDLDDPSPRVDPLVMIPNMGAFEG